MLCCAIGVVETDAGAAPAAGEWDETARRIAGIASEAPGRAELEAHERFVAHGAELDAAWRAFEARQLAPMRSWSREQLDPRIGRSAEVLYPFSGPDLIHPLAILPGRSRYWLLSLEPVGTVPDLDDLDAPELDAFLEGVHTSLDSMLRWSFFQTRGLRADLDRGPGLDGVLPLLLLFAVRDGHQVLAVQHLRMDLDGTLHSIAASPGERPRAEGAHVPGVRLLLRRPDDGSVREVVYYSVDLSSYSLDQRRSFFALVASHGPFTSYLKAASYLMFKPKYRGIERFLLAHSHAILQDASGIPWASLRPEHWQTQLFGRYDGPIPLFAAHLQEDLAEAYRARDDVGPLPFTAGYRTRRGESGMVLAIRREGRASFPLAAESR
jgi:hypothetical protein